MPMKNIGEYESYSDLTEAMWEDLRESGMESRGSESLDSLAEQLWDMWKDSIAKRSPYRSLLESEVSSSLAEQNRRLVEVSSAAAEQNRRLAEDNASLKRLAELENRHRSQCVITIQKYREELATTKEELATTKEELKKVAISPHPEE